MATAAGWQHASGETTTAMVLRREQGGSREAQDVAAAQSGFLYEEGVCWRDGGWKLETFQDRMIAGGCLRIAGVQRRSARATDSVSL